MNSDSFSSGVTIFIVVFLLILIIWSIFSGIYAVRWSKQGKVSGIVLAFFNLLGIILIVICLLFYINAKSEKTKKEMREQGDEIVKSLQSKISELENKDIENKDIENKDIENKDKVS
ncbi:hypothetical protein JTY60_01360 [symbiont of Argiope bruennichi]|uniref:hypothetical protein n=1 Tax=symbiont of Argiope bruennichi TaxID=2810479 RepID=UPI003DA44F50